MDFRLPDLGEGIAEGEIIKWLVKEGDIVEEHQPIVEVETDKALVQVPSPEAGKIVSINARAGEKVHVGDVLCVVGDETASIKPQVKKVDQPQVAKKKGSVSVIGELEEAPDEEETKVQAPKQAAKQSSNVQALPSVRKLADEMGVNLENVKGSGPSGRISEDDVRRASGQAQKSFPEKPKAGPTVAFEKFGRVLRIPLKGIRKAIAENMTASLQTAAHVTHTDWVDITNLAALKDKEKAAAEDKGVKLTFLPFIVKAVVLALKEYPYLNSSLDDSSGDIVIKQYYNIGIAVDTPNGLMVPVVKSPNEKTLIEIGRDIYRVAELARTREIQLKDLQGGTFTITNIGSIGGIFATPIINHPECAILGLGRAFDMAVPLDGEIRIRKMLPISLSFDHRIVDGAMAAKFANEIKRRLEDPDALLIGY
jgi:pyruvate dehydrogenase E2 component (dihydrolipoamide acetyltransferase)